MAASGEWLGEKVVSLFGTSEWTEFRFTGTSPTGAVSFSARVWSGLRASIDVDDMELLHPEAAGLTATGEEESCYDVTRLLMALSSAGGLDLGGLVADSVLGEVLEIGGPVYGSGWSAAPQLSGFPSHRDCSLVQARGLFSHERKSLVVNFEGGGLVTV